MGCGHHHFVVDLIEDLVAEGCSRSAKRAHEHENSQLASPECGSPDILKSMSTSFNIERSACEQTTGLTVYHDWDLGLVGFVRNFFACRGTSPFWLWSNFWAQFSFPVMFQRDLWRRTR